MKTFKFKMNVLPAALIFMVMVMSLPANGAYTAREKVKNDTTYKVYTGKVIDALSKKPVVFANVYPTSQLPELEPIIALLKK